MFRWAMTTAAVLAVMLAVRMLSPSDIFDNDQARPSAHIVDVAVNGHWLMQEDPGGRLATKPPMYPWLGAVAVRLAGGRTDEWVLKAPLWISYLLVAVLIVDMARLTFGGRRGMVVGCLAAAMWAANFHVFKLAYTARTDMLVTGLVTLAVWALLRQRSQWAQGKVRRGEVALFWLAVAAAALTKGPPALLPVGLLVGLTAVDRPGARVRWGWQLGGLMLMLGLVAAWLGPALAAYPQWADNINREVFERATGRGSGATRRDPWWFMPLYLVARPLPWNLLFFAAVGAWLACGVKGDADVSGDAPGRPGRLPLGWAVGWVVFVLIVFMVPRGRRADYLLPAYPAMVIVAAWLVDVAEQRADWRRAFVGVATAVVALVGVGAAVWSWRLPRPAPLNLGPAADFLDWNYSPLIAACAALAGVGGMVSLTAACRGRYRVAAMVGTLAMVGVLGIYQATLAAPAVLRHGDAMTAVARTARAAAEDTGLPIVCHDLGSIGSEAIPALLGWNQPWDEGVLDSLRGGEGAILVVGESAWQAIAREFEHRTTPLALTPVLPNRSTTVQVRILRISSAMSLVPRSDMD